MSHSIFLFFLPSQVLADQAVWAVCGRAAAVIDMGVSAKTTLTVEVMPLVGGHLQLPKVRISKYIPANSGPGVAGTSYYKYSRSRGLVMNGVATFLSLFVIE